MRAAAFVLLACAFLLFAASPATAQSGSSLCPTSNLTCASAGGACNTGYDNTTYTYYTTECPATQFCNAGTCSDFLAVGATCSLTVVGAQCVSPATCAYTGLSPTFTPLYNCTLPYPLFQLNDMGNCNASAPCANNAWCQLPSTGNGNCVPIYAAGAACNSSVQCGVGSWCVGTATGGVCAAGFSAAAGGSCNATIITISQFFNLTSNFSSPLICDSGLACAAGACISPAASTKNPCNGTSDTTCGVDETCVCVAVGGTTFNCVSKYSTITTTQKANYQALWACQNMVANANNTCSANVTCPDCHNEACAIPLFKSLDTCNVGYCPALPSTTATTAATTATTAAATATTSAATVTGAATTATTSAATVTGAATTATTAATTATAAATTATTAATTATAAGTTATSKGATATSAATTATAAAATTTSSSSVVAPVLLFVFAALFAAL